MSVAKNVKAPQNISDELRKPDSISKYKSWLYKKHDVRTARKEENYYGLIASIAKRKFEKSGFWLELIGRLEEYNQKYLRETGYNLVAPTHKPEIKTKPFESLLIKSYRKNILENDLWPNEPEKGWILPKNWLSSINDILRTLFVVKYFDGVNFLIEEISSLCNKHKMASETSLEAREEGYYAAHINTQGLFEIPNPTWDTEITMFSIEIQVTTQVQEVLRKLLHRYYEEKRIKLKKPVAKWQWDYKSDEFAVNYLGHILHYVEGMILEIRERPRRA